MRRRRPRLFLKGKNPRARRRLLATFLLCFAPGTSKAAPAPQGRCVPFATPPAISSSFAADALAVGDLDRDGDLDLVAASGASGELVWFENGGAGPVWTERAIGSLDTASPHVALADLDRDGDLDVVAADLLGTSWYENDGSGHLADAWPLHGVVSASFVAGLAVGDFDGDGDPDVALALTNLDALLWYENDGTPASGVWLAATISQTVTNPVGLAVGDIDRDGDLDVATAEEDGAILWVESGGDGQSWTQHEVSTVLAVADDVALGDLDRDGDLDLVAVAPSLGGSVTLFENDGTPANGTWGLTGIESTPQLGAPAIAVDLEGDGDADVIAGSAALGTLQWVEPTVPQTFVADAHTISTVVSGVGPLAAGDLDRDGDLDLVSASPGSGRIGWHEADALRGGALFDTALGNSTFSFPRNLAAADLEGDGDLDLLSASSGDHVLAWFRNNGQGGFSLVTIATAGNGSYAVATADLDGDGELDVVGGSRLDDAVVWHEGGSDLLWTIHGVTAGADGVTAVAVGDLDRDGDIDVVSVAPYDSAVRWHQNDGAGGGWTTHTIASAFVAFDVVVADLDRDGDSDVAAASSANDDVVWFANDGVGGFGARQTVTETADGVRDLEAADLDRDGDLDLVAASSVADRVAWHENDGDGGGWSEHVVSTTAGDTRAARPGDFDRDGDLDLLVAVFGDVSFSDAVQLFENDGSGDGWTLTTVSTAGNGPIAVAAGDFDGDGDLDAASSSTIDGVVARHDNLGTLVFAEGQETIAEQCWSASPE